MIEAILAEYKTIPDLRLDIQVHHVVRNESGNDNRVRIRWSYFERWIWLHVVGDEANDCELDENNHDGSQINVGNLVITHGNFLEESVQAIQLIWINEGCIGKRINIWLECDNCLFVAVIALSFVKFVPFSRFLVQHVGGFCFEVLGNMRRTTLLTIPLRRW